LSSSAEELQAMVANFKLPGSKEARRRLVSKPVGRKPAPTGERSRAHLMKATDEETAFEEF